MFQEKKEEKIDTHKSKQNKNSNSRAKQRQEEVLEAERRKKVREQTQESVKRLREKRREENRKDGSEDESTCLGTSAFKNRMAKTRALQKTVEVLSQTAAKKRKFLKQLLQAYARGKFWQKRDL